MLIGLRVLIHSKYHERVTDKFKSNAGCEQFNKEIGPKRGQLIKFTTSISGKTGRGT